MSASTWSGPTAYRLVAAGMERSLLHAEVGVGEYQYAPAPPGTAILLPLLSVGGASVRVIPLLGASRSRGRLGRPDVSLIAVRADGSVQTIAWRDPHALITIPDKMAFAAVAAAIRRVGADLSAAPGGAERGNLLRRMVVAASEAAEREGASPCQWRPRQAVAAAPVGERQALPEAADDDEGVSS